MKTGSARLLRLVVLGLFALGSIGLGSIGLGSIGCGAAQALPKNPPLPPPRPAFPDDSGRQPGQPQAGPAQPGEAQPLPAPVAAPVAAPSPPREPEPPGFDLAIRAGLADLARKYAWRHGVPLALLHRVIMRESRYRPGLVNRNFYGLMQITPTTARGMGFRGPPRRLLDAETNLTYATPYLANAWLLADGDADRAVRLYSSGYYDTAKRRHMLDRMRNAASPPMTPGTPSAPLAQEPLPPPPPEPKGFMDGVFGAIR